MKWKQKNILSIGSETGLYLIDDFLSFEECDHLIQIAKTKGLRDGCFRDPNAKITADTPEVSIALFSENEDKIIKKINKQISNLTKIPVDHGEKLKVIHYATGGYYLPHNDYTRQNKKKNGGCRIAQMLFYLNDVEEGGETNFPFIGLKITPEKGRALLWYGIKDMFLPEGDAPLVIPEVFRENFNAIHEPLEIKKGEKWIAAKLLRNIPFPL